MFKGTVEFIAATKDRGMSFQAFCYVPNRPGVGRIELEGPGGLVIRSTVHLTSVETPERGIDLARQANAEALDRIAFRYDLAIESAKLTEKPRFSPLSPTPGLHAMESGDAAGFTAVVEPSIIKVDPQNLKAELEKPSPPGEQYFGLFRSARVSTGHVEEFMFMYSILLAILGDGQRNVDDFICKHEPNVPKKEFKKRNDKPEEETIYTRLRNEIGHVRKGASADQTRGEMMEHLDRLVGLAKRAIELHGT